MERQIYKLLRQCTVRLAIPKVGHGTGFFVAPGLILTCAHVVKAAQPETSLVEVYWSGQRYSAQVVSCVPDQDLALLQVPLTDHPCVLFQAEVSPFDRLYSYGYTDEYSYGDPATFDMEGKVGDREEQLKLKMGQVRPGLSGAPLLNDRTGRVCGIVQLTRDRSSDMGGRGISITVVFEVFPKLLAQHLLFHAHDRGRTRITVKTYHKAICNMAQYNIRDAKGKRVILLDASFYRYISGNGMIRN